MKRTLLLLSAILLATGCPDRNEGAQTERPAQQQQQQRERQRGQQQAPAEPGAAQNQQAQAATPADSPLLKPAELKEEAPAQYRARFETSKGPFVIEVQREWAPQGADRFYNLVKNGFYDDVAFFRAVENFMVQFGIHGDPKVAGQWRTATIPDDQVKQSNERGMVSFATSGPDSRTTQVFINYKDNAFLDRMGFAPFGRVVEGMEVVDSLHKGYGEGAPRGRGPAQGRIQTEGNTYLRAQFPQLDYVEEAKIVEAGSEQEQK